MNRRIVLQSLGALPLLGATLAEGAAFPQSEIYELRVYHVHEGRLDDLLKRFRDHTDTLFEKHGMKSVAYWTPLDDPLKGHRLIYILAHPSQEAALANWKAFQDDPEWKAVKAASEAAGPLADSIESTYMALTDFSSRL